MLTPTTMTMGCYSAMFRGCSSLTNIVLPDTITQISNGVFKDCSNLSTVKYSNNITVNKNVNIHYKK